MSFIVAIKFEDHLAIIKLNLSRIFYISWIANLVMDPRKQTLYKIANQINIYIYLHGTPKK